MITEGTATSINNTLHVTSLHCDINTVKPRYPNRTEKKLPRGFEGKKVVGTFKSLRWCSRYGSSTM